MLDLHTRPMIGVAVWEFRELLAGRTALTRTTQPVTILDPRRSKRLKRHFG